MPVGIVFLYCVLQGLNNDSYNIREYKKINKLRWKYSVSGPILRVLKARALTLQTLVYEKSEDDFTLTSKEKEGIRIVPIFTKRGLWSEARINKAWYFLWRRLRLPWEIKKIKKRLGRWFRRNVNFLDDRHITKRSLMFEKEDQPQMMVRWTEISRRRRIQRHINKFYNNFLIFYRRQFRILRLCGKFYPRFFRFKMRAGNHSKRLWWFYKDRRRTEKWLRRKNFTPHQQYKFYRYKKFFPRLNRLKILLGGVKPRWLIRKNIREYNLTRLQIKTNRILEKLKLGDKTPSYSGLLDQFGEYINTTPGTRFGISNKRDMRSKYFCLIMRKKKNNYYLTVINGVGHTKLFISSGSFLLRFGDKKRNKKLRSSFRYFIEVLKYFANKLKQKRIFKIKYLFKPKGLRRKLLQLVINTLSEKRITVINVLKTRMPRHRIKKKLKKIRRL